MKYTRIPLFIACLAVLLPARAGDTGLDKAVEETVETNEEVRKDQEKIDQLADDTRSMLQVYRNTLQQTDSLKSYNQQLEKLIASQEADLASLKNQLDSVDETQRDIVPLMLHMVRVLRDFIILDMPFLREERMARLETIEKMMDRPDVNLPDKYRRIMEAYQIEMEYGRTLHTGNDTIMKDDKNISVQLLRVGRVVLLYQTLDGEQSGYWDKDAGEWKNLPDKYNNTIANGILIADKKAPPDFFTIPVQPPEKAR